METDKKFIAFEAAVDVFNELPFVDIKTVLGMLIVHYASDVACIYGIAKYEVVDSLYNKVFADLDATDELKKANLAQVRCQKTSIPKRFEDDLEDGQQNDNL